MTTNSETTKDQIGNFCILKKPGDDLQFENIYFECDIPKLVEMAKNGFDLTNISGIYSNPKKAQSLALRSLKERCHQMKQDRINGIQSKLNEKLKLNKLLKASKNYMKGSSNQVMLDEEKVKVWESDLTRLDLEINEMHEQLALLKQKKFELPTQG